MLSIQNLVVKFTVFLSVVVFLFTASFCCCFFLLIFCFVFFSCFVLLSTVSLNLIVHACYSHNLHALPLPFELTVHIELQLDDDHLHISVFDQLPFGRSTCRRIMITLWGVEWDELKYWNKNGEKGKWKRKKCEMRWQSFQFSWQRQVCSHSTRITLIIMAYFTWINCLAAENATPSWRSVRYFI